MLATVRGLRRLIPTPVRHRIRSWANHSHLGQGATLDQILMLLYPDADLVKLRERAFVAAGSRRVGDLSAVRRVLGQLDRQVYGSPVHIRFGARDVSEVEVRGIRLALDSADSSVSAPLLNDQRYEAHVTRVFEHYCKPGMTVVDVGANVGYFTMLASRLVGPTGRVVAVEPNSDNCRLILLSSALNHSENVELLPVALAEKRGWSYFSTFVGSNGGFQPGSVEAIRNGHGSVVPTFALDDLLAGPIHLLKIDVEGAEARVIRGAARMLQTYRPIVIAEFSREMLERVSAVPSHAFFELFTRLGYRLHVIDRQVGTITFHEPFDLLNNWPDPLAIEDLLFLPAGVQVP